MQSSTHHKKYNQSQSHAYASKVLDFAIAVGRISEVDMLASKYFLELQTKLSKTSKCRLEGSREIQSICNRRLIGKKFGVLKIAIGWAAKVTVYCKVYTYRSGSLHLCNLQSGSAIADQIKYSCGYLKVHQCALNSTEESNQSAIAILYKKTFGFCNCIWLDCTSNCRTSTLQGSHLIAASAWSVNTNYNWKL